MQPWSTVDLPAVPGQGLPVMVHDNASQRLTVPVAPGDEARLYVCGITPYDSTHMGHASTYVAFDVLSRAWQDSGCSVKYVQNVTDIDDPLFERAAKTGVPWQDIATREMDRFRDDMTALRVLPPNNYVTVTEHIDGIISWIEDILAAGFAYTLDGDVYFDVEKAGTLGDVSHLGGAEMLSLFAQRGGDPDRAGKRSPLDPILWVRSKPDEPSWTPSFGEGRPGWHIECVAIAIDHLGGSVSVQGGGRDLVFPHHEMCNAQAPTSGRISHFADAYLHAGMVSLDGEKMSKSLGNLVFISDLRHRGIDPMAIRLAIMSHHYAQDWEWTDQKLSAAIERLNHWREALAMQGGADAMQVLQQVRIALSQNLDTPHALASIDDWARKTLSGDSSDPTAQGLIARTLDALLGLAL